MHILCVTSSYPRHAKDASGRFVHELARGLLAVGARDGDTMHVLTPDDDGSTDLLEKGSLSLNGVRVTRVRYAMTRRAQRLFYRSGAPENLSRERGLFLRQAPLATAALALAVARHAPRADVVLAHWMVPSGLAAIAACSLSKKRVVVVAHSGDVFLLEKLPFGAQLARLIARRAHAVVAVADDVRARLRALGVDARTLPLGAELPPASASREVLRARLGVAPSRPLVFALGRQERVKGHDVLIDALCGIDATLVLAGDGSEHGALCKRAVDRGVELHAGGFADAQQKADLLRAADVVVFPSRRLDDGRSEGLPVSLLEARLAGAAIIASDVGGVREALRATDVLVPPGDAPALREALLRRFAALDEAGAPAPAADPSVDPFSLSAAAARYRAALVAAVAA